MLLTKSGVLLHMNCHYFTDCCLPLSCVWHIVSQDVCCCVNGGLGQPYIIYMSYICVGDLQNVYKIQKENSGPPCLAFVQQNTYLYSPFTTLISTYIRLLSTSSFSSLFLSFFILPLIFPSQFFV